MRYWTITSLLSQITINSIQVNNDKLSSYLGSFILFLEVFIVVALGGFIFTDSLAENIKNVCLQYQNELQNTLINNLSLLEENLNDSFKNLMLSLREYLEALRNIAEAPEISPNKVKEVVSKVKKFLAAVVEFKEQTFSTIPKRYQDYIVAMFFSNFPGGIYGIIIFTFFTISISIVLKVFQLYLESPLLHN